MPTSFEEYAEDGALVLGGAVAILLQLGDPVVARGVAEHSAFARDPLRRLRTTLSYVYAVSLGDAELDRLAARFVDRAHRGVPGADDPEHQLWVAATLYATGVDIHARLFGELSGPVADEVYRRSARLGTALQLPPGAWPVDRSAFSDYWEATMAGLTIGEEARAVCRDLLHPRAVPWWMRALMPLMRLVTAGLLPATVRSGYGMPWSPARNVRFRVALAIIRALVRVTPGRLRTLPSRRLLAALRAHG